MGLVFRAVPGPRMRVETRGAWLSDRLRHALEDRLREGALASDALEQGRELVEDDFRRRGYRAVAVSNREEAGPDSATVIYDVRPGPASRVSSVAVDGFPDLAPLLKARPGAPVQDRLNLRPDSDQRLAETIQLRLWLRFRRLDHHRAGDRERHRRRVKAVIHQPLHDVLLVD